MLAGLQAVVDITRGSHLGPRFRSCRGAALLKIPCVVLDYFVVFYKGPLASTTLEVITKTNG